MGERDEVWQHGENLFSGFKCMYCLKEFQQGGATRLKEHLAGKCGNISRCNKCPPNIRNYFLRELQRIREQKKAKKEERFHRVQSTMPLSDDEDEELQEAVEVSRREAEFQRRAGERYEHGGGSGAGGGGVRRFFRRTTSQRKRSRDFDVARATAPVQTWIDTSSSTSKGKSAKEAIRHAWSKWFHVSGIPGRNADNPYFISAVKQTQQ
jgi:macrodomain Ter protein organizer (MatP/YcbG family)